MIPRQNSRYENAYTDLIGNGKLNYHPGLKKLVCEEAYQKFTGLFTEWDNPLVRRPLACVAFHPGDDLISGMFYDRWVKACIAFKTVETVGMGVNDFMDLTVREGLTVLYNCQSYAEEIARQVEAIQAEQDKPRK